MTKIGIYSGTFDPIHLGHVAFAKEAIKQCGLDQVYFLVEPRPRRKQGVKALEHRQEMVQLAIQDEPQLGSIVLNQARFDVSKTLPILQARFDGADISFLMGDDVLAHFTDADWPNLDEFVEAMKLIIGLRKQKRPDISKLIKVIEATRGIKINYQTFKTEQALNNSAQVRSQLRRGHASKDIDERVLAYIRQHQLYLPTDDN